MARGVLIVFLVLAAATVHSGCGDDDGSGSAEVSPTPMPSPGPAPTLPPPGAASPTSLLTDMALKLATSLAAKELGDLIFPSGSIDYETLVEDFLAAIQRLLDQQTIDEQEGIVNGLMANLNEVDVRFAATTPPPPYVDSSGSYTTDQARDAYLNDPGYQQSIDDIYVSLITQDGDVNEALLTLAGFGEESLAGWMSAAQLKASYLALETQLLAIRNPSDLGTQVVLATDLGSHGGDDLIHYAVSTRNSILYSNVVDASGGGGCFCDSVHRTWSFDDCHGQTHQGSDCTNPDQCVDDLVSTTEECAAETFGTQDPSVAWIGDMVDSWREALAGLGDEVPSVSQPCVICEDSDAFIVVDSASVNLDVSMLDLDTHSPIANGVVNYDMDATTWFRAACDDLQTCDFEVYALVAGSVVRSVEVNYHCGSNSSARQARLGPEEDALDQAYIHLGCAPAVTNAASTFRGQPLGGQVVDAVPHALGFTDAFMINDNVVPPDGTAWNDPTYAIVLPTANNPRAASLVIDLGQVLKVCGNGFDCKSRPVIQADHNDEYQLDYSTDGSTWTRFGVFPTVSDGGLRTRAVNPDTGNVAGNSFDARYLRVYPISGDGKYSVSELDLWEKNSQPIGEHQPAFIHAGLLTNGPAPNGTAWNDPNWAIVLPDTGPGWALTVDLGEVVTVCGGGNDCPCRGCYPEIQADHNDEYQLDYSTDGSTWLFFGYFPSVGGSGLQLRYPILNSSDPNQTNFAARYLRVFPTSGDGSYSVSHLQVNDISGDQVSLLKPAGFPEPLVSNGEYAPAGTAWNDDRYATVLGGEGPDHAVTLNLGRVIGVDQVSIEADQNDQYQLDVSTDGVTWYPWYVAPEASGSGLQIRSTGLLPRKSARYVRVYAVAGDGAYSVSEVQLFAASSPPSTGCGPACTFSVVAALEEGLAGVPATTADLQDLVTTWTCGADSTQHVVPALPWNDDAVAALDCSQAEIELCNPAQLTTCSNFLLDQPDDVVYAQVSNYLRALCPTAQYPDCVGALESRTDFYHCESGSASCSIATMNDPACTNVQRAIDDAIAEGLCPPALGEADSTWPYGSDIGDGATDTCLPNPANQVAFLRAVGCENPS